MYEKLVGKEVSIELLGEGTPKSLEGKFTETDGQTIVIYSEKKSKTFYIPLNSIKFLTPTTTDSLI